MTHPTNPRRRPRSRSFLGRMVLSPIDRWAIRTLFVSLLLSIMLFVGAANPFSLAPGLFATASAHGLNAQATKPTPNRFDPRTNARSVTYPGFGAGTTANQKPGPPQSIKRGGGITMQPGILALMPGHQATFKGSDGKLEIEVAADAVTNADVAAAGGTINLLVSQIAPASGSSAGGSGLISFGTYLVQAVDAQGVLLTHGLRQPLTFTLHYSSREAALDLSNAFVVFNGALPDGTALAPLAPSATVVHPGRGGITDGGAATVTSTMANSGFGPYSSQPATLDTKTRSLVVSYTLSDPSGSMSWNTDAPVATFGKPDAFNVDLNAGALTSSIPIDVPSGPGGLTPPVNLTYSSAGVSEQHSPQGAAGWVGEGWNLDLGSISWAEHNSNASCGSNCSNGWEDTWQLSDPFGTGAELIPPNINVSTYYDDTSNSITASPIRWHSTPENYAKIYSYTGSLTLPDSAGVHPPCFRVFLTNGVMEEFGCTSDSLEYYYAPGMGDYISSWKLDLITDPQGNQIHITYTQDVEQKNVSGVNHQYIRDAVLQTIEWDSPNCLNAQSMCTGSNWAPLMRVNFAAAHLPARLTNTPTNCNTASNLRCDDPRDLSGSSGLAAPDVQSTYVLNDAQVQVRSSGSGSWNTLKDYQFSYAQNGTGTITDPSTGKSESVAGYLLLSQFVEAGTDATTALMYSGMDNSSTTSYAYLKTLDLSSQNIAVSSNTTLSYWIFPQSSATNAHPSGSNSTCVAIDMIFSDGTDLRDSGAVDQNGVRLHPAAQCGHLKLDQWNLVTSNIGAVVSGKTINRIDVGYDQAANTGGYRGYVDGISLTNGTTTLFSTSFEPGQTQPTWTNTVDTGPGSGGNILNVGGVCCSLPGPELGTRIELAHPSVAMPTRTFSYGYVTQYYEDDIYHPNPSTSCGPSWNTGNGSGCLLWSQSYAPNSWYLTSSDNGIGLHQIFTWANGRNNSHGVNGGGTNNADPLYCNTHQTGYPCNEADDQNWSHAVLTKQEGDVIRAASSGNQTVQSVTQYAYKLTYPLPAQECSDCVAGMYWGNQNNGDYLDYYDGKFMGFAEADVSNPDGSIVKHKYLSTEGYGLYDASVPCLSYTPPCHVSPWWDLGNVAHGHEYQTDYYDSNGSTLLKEVTTQYQAVCPPSGVSGSPSWSTTLNGNPYTYTWNGNLVAELDHGNPVAVCDVQTKQTDTYTLDGASDTFSAPHQSTSSVYDGLGRVTYQTTGSDTGLKADYYDNSDLTNLKFTRLDATVNNSWGDGSPFPTIDRDTFSVRWTGYVKPQYTGTYTFYTNSDDGVRLWVNNVELVNNWTNHAPTENSGAIALTAGQLYPITLEYYENTGGAIIQFSWSEASQPKQIIPATAFFTRADGGSGTAVGSIPATVTYSEYVQNDAVTATSTGATGIYLLDTLADTITQDGGNTTHYSCSYTGYDGQGWATGQQSTLTRAEATSHDQYTTCAPTGNSGLIRTNQTYDSYGNQLTTTDPDANAGNSSHLGCTSGGTTTYSTCAAFDSIFHSLPTSTTNALSQSTLTSYGTPASSNGFGLWPISTTDQNGQATTYTYDALGRMISQTLPGETNSPTTRWTYTDWCAATGAQTPCLEIDQTQRLDSSTTVTTRAFYDGYGNLVETRDPAPNGKDIVRYRYYDPSGRDVFDSISYLVPAYTGGPGASAFSTPDASQVGTTTTYDGAGRTTSVKDASSEISATSYSVECGWVGDAACYEMTIATDANAHQSSTFTDALGRKTYSRTFTGNSSSTYTVYTTSMVAYDANGNLVKITQPNGKTTTYTYNAANRKTGVTDPDRGHEVYSYDADGNLIQATDARGMISYTGFDGIDRQTWRNTSNTSTGAYVTFSYDSTANGNYGVGHLTGETFTSPTDATLTGSYSYTYDLRGRATASTTVLLGTSYTTQMTYDDAGNQTSLTYPDGETVTNGYTAQGWLGQVSTSQGNTTLLSNVDYSGIGGAAHLITGANLGNNLYHYSATYDALLHLTDTQITRLSDSTKLFEESRTFDPVNNVSAVSTQLPAGTDNQLFCYDEQNRLTWAGTTTGNPCGNTAATGTFTGADYTQSFSYDTLDRLTNGPLGSYTYGDSAHLHAATQIGSGGTAYTASYDASGDMLCRAPDGSTSCSSGSTTGQQLTWDNESHLTAWQNTPSSPTNTASYLYDSKGNRVAQKVSVNNGTTTTTTTTKYIGSLEEVSTSSCTGSLCPRIASGPQTTTYYYAAGKLIAEAVNGAISYLVVNAQGTPLEALDGSGNVTASRLYSPYGPSRYSSGTFPTSYGYTGQRADSSTGLDYFGARYYDSVAGQFISADPAGDGLNLFAYVHGNPETLTDPTGLWTGGVCVGGTAGVPGLGVFGEACFVGGWDPNAGWSGGLTLTGGGPANTGFEVGSALSLGVQVSNAATVDDLGGPFTYGGAGGSIDGVGVYGTGFGGRGTHGQAVGGLEGGWQGGENFDIHAGESETKVIDFNQLKHIPFVIAKASGAAVSRATGWAGQQLGRVKSSVGRQLGNVVHHVKQQVRQAKNWATQRLSRVEMMLDRQIGGFGNWAGQQWNRATSWVSQQWNTATSWAGQQLGRVGGWFGL